MSFQSVHDLLTPPAVIRKTKFWDWFDGDSLKSWWTLTHKAGSGSGAMNDAVDGGYRITTGSTSSDNSIIDFNSINHYASNASMFIGVFAPVESTSRLTHVGMDDSNSFGEYSFIENDTSDTFIGLKTRDGVTTTQIDSTVAIDEVYHNHRIVLGSASHNLFMDGTLEVAKTTNLPTADLQPAFRIFTRTSASRSIDCLRCEVYNT